MVPSNLYLVPSDLYSDQFRLPSRSVPVSSPFAVSFGSRLVSICCLVRLVPLRYRSVTESFV